MLGTREGGGQEAARLRDGAAGGGGIGEGVEDDEGVNCADVSDGSDVDARVGEPAGILFAFVAQRVVLGRDDDRGR